MCWESTQCVGILPNALVFYPMCWSSTPTQCVGVPPNALGFYPMSWESTKCFRILPNELRVYPMSWESTKCFAIPLNVLGLYVLLSLIIQTHQCHSLQYIGDMEVMVWLHACDCMHVRVWWLIWVLPLRSFAIIVLMLWLGMFKSLTCLVTMFVVRPWCRFVRWSKLWSIPWTRCCLSFDVTGMVGYDIGRKTLV